MLSKTFSFILLVFSMLILAQDPGLQQIEQDQGVKIKSMSEGYLPLVNDARLLRSGCKVKNIPGKGDVLMAIGVIAVKPSQIPGQSLALALEGAMANARAEMTKFLYGVTNQTATEVHDMLDVKTFTREEANGFVRAAQKRGEWIANDGSVLGVLMVYERNAAALANSFRDEMNDTTTTLPAESQDGRTKGKPVGNGVVENIDKGYDPD